MADCAIYQQQLDKIVDNQLISLQDRYNSYNQQLRNPNITSIQIGNILREVKQLSGDFSYVSGNLKTLNKQAADAGCTQIAQETVQLNSQLGQLRSEVFVLENSIPKLLDKVKAQEAATQQATTKDNNAGTGTPGTAGTGPGATPAPAPSPTIVANATPAANATATTTGTGTSSPALVPTTTGANANTATTTTGTGTTKPATVNPTTGTAATAAPAIKPVPSTAGNPGTVQYIASLIAQQPVKGENALATACPDKAKATATVKKLIADLNAQIAAQIPTAKGADGKPATSTEKNALTTQLQGANSKLSKTLKDIEAKDCAKEAAAATAAAAAAPAATPSPGNTNNGLPGQIENTRQQATIQDTTNFEQMQDWRVRLCLSPGADYLYKAPEGQRGILDPLSKSNGIVFPYTPTVTVSYAANYDMVNPTHSNYKVLQYTNSSVDNVSIGCDFTAQDTREANYLLAVIHFFRTVTKMWYGQDQFPKPGTPPPLVYLFGLGQFQFNAHPLVITNFTYTLPADVDYIRAGTPTTNPGVSKAPAKDTKPSSSSSLDRLRSAAVQIGSNILNSILPGGESGPANFTPAGFSAVTPAGTVEPTYVPTKINLQIQCMPIVSRNDVSNRFSLKDYASGKLLRGTKEKGGGFW